MHDFVLAAWQLQLQLSPGALARLTCSPTSFLLMYMYHGA